MKSRGFTLLELLLAMMLLAIVTTIVYASFATVIGSIEIARAAGEELRLRQYIEKSLSTNFTSAYISAQMMYAAQNLGELNGFFEGLNGEGAEGPTDSVRFVSTAPIIGGTALPGQLKMVSYEVVANSALDADRLDFSDEPDSADRPSRMLEAIEAPWSAAAFLSSSGASQLEETELEEQALHWTVPIRSMDITYFDGSEWQEGWEWPDRLPWCVYVRINFARTKDELDAEKAAGINPGEDPDLEMVIPIPMGLGVEVTAATAGAPSRFPWASR